MKWNEVFSSRSKVGDYFVKPPWQAEVVEICQQVAVESQGQCFDSMVSVVGTVSAYRLLDGSCLHVEQFFWRIEGWSNGVWVNGRKVFRYCVYCLGLEQPRRYSDEREVPSFQKLQKEIDCAEETRAQEQFLMDSASRGDLEAISRLLDQGVNVNAGQRYTYTPLLYAVYNGQIEVVRLLIDRGANIEEKTYNYLMQLGSSTTPIEMAASRGYKEIVELLLESKCLVSEQRARELLEEAESNERYKRLCEAVQSGNTKVVTRLLGEGVELRGTSVVVQAARLNRTEVVELLLAHNADPNASQYQDGRWINALSLAIEKGNAKIVKMLLAAGLDIREDKGEDLKEAKRRGHMDIVDLLRHAGVVDEEHEEAKKNKGQRDARKEEIKKNISNKNEAIILAARDQIGDLVKELIEEGADVNARNEFGFTVLMIALNPTLFFRRVRYFQMASKFQKARKMAKNNRTDLYCIVEILIKSGADVNAKDSSDKSVLDHATEEIFYFHGIQEVPQKIIDLLQHAGAQS